VPTFLVDGRIAGAWRFDGGAIQLEPYEALPAAVLRELREEGNRLAASVGG
jgi:hypothetical protein